FRGGIRAVVYLYVLLWSIPAVAQNATLRGFVTDASDGQPLQGVNVILRGGDENVLGTVTTPDGIYVIGNIAPGRYELQASFIAFASYVDTLDLPAGDARHLDIMLSDADTEVGEIMVEAERETGAARITAGQQRVL